MKITLLLILLSLFLLNALSFAVLLNTRHEIIAQRGSTARTLDAVISGCWAGAE